MVTTPQISGLATRLAAPARLLAMRLGRKTRSPRDAKAAIAPTPGAILDGRLHVPVLQVSPESELWAKTRAEHSALTDEGRWAELLALLRRADSGRTAAPGGRRLASLISEGARARLTALILRRDWTGALEEIDRFAEIQAAHPDDAMASHLLAQAHLDYGWGRRSAEPGPGVPREVWQDFLHHIALAEAALGDFDPIEEESHLLAGTRYLLVRGLEDGDANCRDWYEDWSDLDPTNPEPHLTHAPHLLPQWFGSLSGFDEEAKAAMQRTRHCTGVSAYALFHLAAAESLGDLPPGVDQELYVAGLIDYFHATGCQYRANIVAAALTELHHALTDAPAASQRRLVVLETLDDHIRNEVREFHLSAWENGAAGIAYALTQVFGREMTRNEHIFLGPEGIEVRLPL